MSNPAEKSISVNREVTVKLCVAEGDLRINGWERDEIRVFIAGGNGKINFKTAQKGNPPGAVVIVAGDSSKNKQTSADECLAGERIEIDVPRGAIVNVKSRESETRVDSIAGATIENVGGGIYVNRIAKGVDATTYDGDITIENSGGSISLTTTTGNIVAFNLTAGDALKTKTNSGAIVLRQVGRRQIEANSNSGAINFTGELFAGGRYVFNAFSGSVNLRVPQNTSCELAASYGFGAFTSEIPLHNTVKSAASVKPQNLSAQIGAGGATALTVSTFSGTIQIKKQ